MQRSLRFLPWTHPCRGGNDILGFLRGIVRIHRTELSQREGIAPPAQSWRIFGIGSLRERRWKFPDEGLGGRQQLQPSVASRESSKGIKIHIP